MTPEEGVQDQEIQDFLPISWRPKGRVMGAAKGKAEGVSRMKNHDKCMLC